MNILWVGGPAAAGKTTISRLLARKYGLLWYSVDAHAFTHEKRAAAAGLHVMDTGPGDFDRKPMILEDVQSLSVAAVVEGAFVTPEMAGVGENAVWLMPSQEEQLERLERRNPGGTHDGLVWGWSLVHSQLQGTNATVVTVDGQTVQQTLTAVEHKFATFLNTCPKAQTPAERQSLTRTSNHQLATSRHQTLRTLDCECGRPDCTELVELPAEAAALRTQAPPPILSPNCRSVDDARGA